MKETASLVGVALVVYLGYVTFMRNDTYTAMYEIPAEQAVLSAGQFESRELCLEALAETRRNTPDAYSLECGKNCTPPKSEYGLYRCDGTVDL